MLIGSKYSDNKLYRGIKHYDKLPLLAEDIHESLDTLYMKNSYILNNIVGSGVILNNPEIALSSTSVTLKEPIVLHIDGDIVLIQASNSNPIYTVPSDVTESSTREVYLVGWYQHITSSNTIKEYGGIDNNTLTNDIMDETLNVQVSSRYQFRWMVVDKDSSADTLVVNRVDADGTRLEGGDISIPSTGYTKGTYFKLATFFESMTYIVPLMQVNYANGTIASVTLVDNKKNSTPDISNLRFNQSVYSQTIVDDSSTSYQLPSIDIVEGDIISVIYEGLTLIPAKDYNIIWSDSGQGGNLVLSIDTKIGEVLTIIHNKLYLDRG